MGLAIIISIIVLLIVYLILKPYFIKYDTTLLFTGGLGTGKTLNAVKIAIKQYRKNLFSIRWENWKIRIKNKIRNKHNQKAQLRHQKGKKWFTNLWQIEEEHELPRLISNIPVRIRKGKKELWSNVLEKEMLTMVNHNEKGEKMPIKKIPEYSIVFIDEVHNLINQFNWNIEEVQNNVNEYMTFFRHYIDGKFIMTSQADSQVVKQIRDKMNTYYWLTNFRKFLHFFYKCDICQFISAEVVGNVNTGFIEDNTKTIYGQLFRKHYDSRCYSERYTKLPQTPLKRWNKFKTNKIIRFNKYKSPLDTEKDV